MPVHALTPIGEARFDTDTLARVTALAQKLQSRHEETLSAREIEAIGAEVGLNPELIRLALAQVAGEAAAPPAKESEAEEPLLPEAWATATAFSLPALAAALTALFQGNGDATALLFFASPVPVAVLAGSLLKHRRLRFLVGAETVLAQAIALVASSGTHGYSPNPSDWGFLLLYLLVGIPVTGSAGMFGLRLRRLVARFRERPPALPAAAPAAVSAPAALPVGTLVELMVAVQRELEAKRRRYAVLSVDVEAPLELKRGASELEIELTFRAYRAWVEEVVRQHDGEVHAGVRDELLCLFPGDAEALRAARRLQESVDDLNRTRNRLGRPLELRCGVAAGDLAYEPGMSLARLYSPLLDRVVALQHAAAPGDILVGPELAGAGLTELGALASAPATPAGEPAFSWRNGGRGEVRGARAE